MKYKRGSIVEVLTMAEAPCHSWCCAKIVSGNGHNYTVRYDAYPGFTNAANVERVARKFIRPCPPPVEFSKCLIPGELVEVFHDRSWKTASVLKVLGFDLFLVRLVGSPQGFEVSKQELRVRQSWQKDEWVVIGKVRDSEAGKSSDLLNYNMNSGFQDKQKDAKGNFHQKVLSFTIQNYNTLQGSRIVATKTLKRKSPYCYPQLDANKGTGKKLRVAEKEGRRLRLLLRSPEKGQRRRLLHLASKPVG